MFQARTCWSVLANQLKDKKQALQHQVLQTQQRVQQLQTSLDKLLSLYEEYRKKEHLHALSTGLQERRDQRHFMKQLLDLQQRIQDDLSKTKQLLQQQQAQLKALELEHLKMQTLAENELVMQKKEQQKTDQRRLDESALMRYNLRAEG
jgi:flagellar biosynthesis chaperone FliJ